MAFTLAHPAVILSLKNKKPNMFNLLGHNMHYGDSTNCI
ncbi:DUF4184 family protein [Clostridium tagluense]|nr:DUF4184 family protein [Clostridium tagluense]MCB2299492.1 DUF4184 family protein [Clostridium tagluense]